MQRPACSPHQPQILLSTPNHRSHTLDVFRVYFDPLRVIDDPGSESPRSHADRARLETCGSKRNGCFVKPQRSP